jgi:hypothetical protein
MKKMILIGLILSLAALGCSTFAIVNKNEFAAQLAVEAATARVLHQHPDWKASAVSITDAAMGMINQNALVDLSSVEGYVKNKINWTRLLPEEQALVSALISECSRNIEDDLRSKNIEKPELRMIEVRKLIGWINETARRAQ